MSEELPQEAAKPEFTLKAFFDEDDLVGCRWWNDSFVQAMKAQAGTGRRPLLTGLAVAVVSVGAAATGLVLCRRDDQVDFDALMLQRRDGWDVGTTGTTLTFTRAVQLDSAGDPAWAQRLGTLPQALAPRDPRLAPFAVPTLFQVVADSPASARLIRQLHPVYSEEMRTTHARGAALADLATAPGAPRDVALVLDLPGPQSVALAAALANQFAPVFMFDNWPHPRGVVPSHQTLGAAIYYRPTFEAAKRDLGAPPVFVLDSARLAPYRDEATVFDNRYVVNLPSADQLKALGIKRVLYVRPDGKSLQELDDLNADFVALERGGIDVKAVALDDFQQADVAQGSAGQPTPTTGYYYGGHPGVHLLFWSSYGWGPQPLLRPGVPRPTLPPHLAARPAYRPTPRATMFSSRAVGGAAGVGKQKPSGFGRVSVRSPDGGRTVRSVSSGGRRSGSFTRSRSSYSA